VDSIGRGARIEVQVDGRPAAAHAGESVLALLWAGGARALHWTARTGEPRAFLCGIGVCFDCLVTIDGARSVRACMTPVAPGMRIETQRDAGRLGPAAGSAGA
jgi:predicted molibdopterin-dependent oxidoreductase YjgC